MDWGVPKILNRLCPGTRPVAHLVQLLTSLPEPTAAQPSHSQSPALSAPSVHPCRGGCQGRSPQLSGNTSARRESRPSADPPPPTPKKHRDSRAPEPSPTRTAKEQPASFFSPGNTRPR